MLKNLYSIIVGLPTSVPVVLIIIGLLTFAYKLSDRLIMWDVAHPALVMIGLIVGIVAGIVGIIVGIIQIGVFFGWWPKKLP